MLMPNDSTTPNITPRDLESLRRRSAAFLDFESSVSDMRSAADMSAALLEDTMRPANPKDYPSIAGFTRSGYKVFILTETQARILDYAAYHAVDVARRLGAQWDNAHEAST